MTFVLISFLSTDPSMFKYSTRDSLGVQVKILQLMQTTEVCPHHDDRIVSYHLNHCRTLVDPRSYCKPEDVDRHLPLVACIVPVVGGNVFMLEHFFLPLTYQ